eukprot:m.77201 g.77201  ORF g.77201 m.77201 type:complete len:427 (+) comp14684_c0_seq1:65-1345(+)
MSARVPNEHNNNNSCHNTHKYTQTYTPLPSQPPSLVGGVFAALLEELEERVLGHCGADALDPLLHLLGRLGLDLVRGVLALHQLAVLHLGRLDHVVLVLLVDLKDVRPLALDGADLQVLQWNGAFGLVVVVVLKVVDAVVAQGEPAPPPRLARTAFFDEPAVALRVDKGAGGAVAVRDFERRALDAVIQTGEEIVGQVLAVVDASVHADEGLQRRLQLDARVVQACVEHDGGKGQHVARVLRGEGVWVAYAEADGKLLHESVNLLRLAGQPEAPQVVPQSLVKVLAGEVVEEGELAHSGEVQRLVLADKLADLRLVEPLGVEEEGGNGRGRLLQELVLDEEVDALLCALLVEDVDAAQQQRLLVVVLLVLIITLKLVQVVQLGLDLVDGALQLLDLVDELFPLLLHRVEQLHVVTLIDGRRRDFQR